MYSELSLHYDHLDNRAKLINRHYLQYQRSLYVGLPVARKGVHIGDEIEKVNDKSIRSLTHAQIVTTILEVKFFFHRWM